MWQRRAVLTVDRKQREEYRMEPGQGTAAKVPPTYTPRDLIPPIRPTFHFHHLPIIHCIMNL
jgi:hypothetical protein